MRHIVWSEYISLDGVVEEPGEWSIPYFSDDLAHYKTEELYASDALLLGRSTYEGFAAAWPEMEELEGDFAVRMNTLPKYVASTTLEKANWNNSTIIRENVAEQVAKLKQQPGKNILIGGSAALVKSLMEHNLIDEIRMLVHPIAVGNGKRLFEGSNESIGLKLVDTRAFDSGTCDHGSERCDCVAVSAHAIAVAVDGHQRNVGLNCRGVLAVEVSTNDARAVRQARSSARPAPSASHIRSEVTANGGPEDRRWRPPGHPPGAGSPARTEVEITDAVVLDGADHMARWWTPARCARLAQRADPQGCLRPGGRAGVGTGAAWRPVSRHATDG